MASCLVWSLRDTGRVMAEESTAPDLVELTRQAVTALGRRDLDACMGFFAADAIWDASQTAVGTFEGRVAIRAFLEDWVGVYEDYEMEAGAIRNLGQGIVFSVNHQSARLAGSEGRVRETYAVTFEFGSAGLITLVRVAQDVDTARVAAERLAEERG